MYETVGILKIIQKIVCLNIKMTLVVTTFVTVKLSLTVRSHTLTT